jgi:N-acetylmuramoyl-L-alanine amidase
VATTIVSLLATAAAGQQLILTRDAVEPLPILGSVDSEDLTPPDDPMLIEPGAVVAPPSLTEAAIAVASAAPAGPAFPTASPEIKYTRVARPTLTGPRRVGIQAGHWLTTEAPPELWRLVAQTGTTWNGVREVDINLDIAKRIKALLETKGVVVDILPTVVPAGYLADAFVSLHGDGDGTGAKSGFKMAYSTRRTPYEQDLLLELKDEYRNATGLEYDAVGVTRNMLGYWNFNWQRYKNATAAHTPSVILEMGFVSNDHDRELMTEQADLVANGIAKGILRFLDDHPREKLFGQDLLVPAVPAFGPPPSPRP